MLTDRRRERRLEAERSATFAQRLRELGWIERHTVANTYPNFDACECPNLLVFLRSFLIWLQN